MKINQNFVLREVAGSFVVLPYGGDVLDFNGMLYLNDTGAFLWRTLESGCSKEKLVEALVDEYEVEAKEAVSDVDTFLEKLTKIGCLDM